MDAPLPPGLCQAWGTVFEKAYRSNLSNLVFDDPIVFPLQRRRELKAMLALAGKHCPKTVMEIGTDKGAGLLHWCMLPTVERVIACEIRGTPYRKLFEARFPAKQFLWLEASSYEPGVVRSVSEWLGSHAIDCLFIDGDKCAFERDFDVYLPLTYPAGLVFMHDIQDEVPGAAYQRVISRGYKHEEIIDIEEAIALRNAEPATEHQRWLKEWDGRSCGVGAIHLGTE